MKLRWLALDSPFAEDMLVLYSIDFLTILFLAKPPDEVLARLVLVVGLVCRA